MKTKLKYLKLFEGISQSDIPYSYIDNGSSSINIPPELNELPEIYNQLTNELIGDISIITNSKLITINSFNNLNRILYTLSIDRNQLLTNITGFNNLKRIPLNVSIENNPNLTNISGFNNLTRIGEFFSVDNNPNLTNISGFNNLIKIKDSFYLYDNHKLITLSIPSTIIKSLKSEKSYIWHDRNQWRINDDKDKSIFINNKLLIQDCIYKFDPAIHPDVVVKQIIENLELWGEPKTITTIINHILSKGDYWEYIPESIKQYVEEKYHHLYNSKYANTGARGIAKMNTGRYLGMF